MKLISTTQNQSAVPKEFLHFIGTWKWESSKFLKHPAGSTFTVKYKTPETEGHEMSLTISPDGIMKTYLNDYLQHTYLITSYKYSAEETNIPVFHHFRIKSTERVFLFFKRTIEIMFYQWEDKKRFSAMYFFPFTKKDGASYNWFCKT